MELRGVRKVAVSEALCLVLEVLPNQRNLVQSPRILRNYSLNSPCLGHSEDVHGLGYIKWHHAMGHLMHMLLRGLSQRRSDAE